MAPRLRSVSVAGMTWALATVAALLIAYAAVSRRLGPLNVSGAMFFTTAGLLVGLPGLVDLDVHREQVKLLAEITLTLVLFADASRISLRALRRQYIVPLRLLGLGLPLTIVAGALVGAAVLPGVTVAEAVVLAIVLACTDAALGQAVVSDERVPSRIRQGLNVESGLNDGLCVPLFFIAIAIAETDAGETSAGSATQLVSEQIGYGLIGGIAAGALGAVLLIVATRRKLIEPHWLQILSVATAFLAAGIANGLGGSIFIAAFTGGFLFGTLRGDTGGEVTLLVDEGGEVFNAVTFVVFGAVILGPMLDEVTWQIVLYALVSLTVVRMLPVALAMLGTGARAPTVAFLGWFGPRGLASVVFAVILIDDTELPHLHTLLLAITVTIALSVYAHGLTARPLTERYVRWWNSHPHDARPAMESVPAQAHRLRIPAWGRSSGAPWSTNRATIS
jgi:NhaP-type Na+/H+ or K+/H+ antiporter